MSTLRLLLPGGRGLRMLDALLAVWVVLWIALGVAVNDQVRGLDRLSRTVIGVGGALEQTGAVLKTLAVIPVVGQQIAPAAQQVADSGAQAVRSGEVSRSSIRGLSWMLALAIAVIPSLPIVGFYLPLRVRLRRERQTLARLVALHGDDPEFRRFLAHRALFTLPYTPLAVEAQRPWHDYREGEIDQLADMELARLGLLGEAPPAP